MFIFVLIDKSGSMDGEPIKQAYNMIDGIAASLVHNSVTTNAAKLCVIEYNISAVLQTPPTEVRTLNISGEMNCSGPKNLGEALKLAINQNVVLRGSSLFVITKGKPSDVQLFNEETPKAKSIFENIYVLHGNIEKSSIYQSLTNNIIPWTAFNSNRVIRNIYGGHEIMDADGRELLQAPPKTIEIAI